MAAQVVKCSTCNHFKPINDGKIGLCVHNPPAKVDNKVEENTDDGRWPKCFPAEWCGEWEKKS